jgi:excisionase family DNA binding protein
MRPSPGSGDVAAGICRHIATDGSVTIPPRIAAWLESKAGMAPERRLALRGTDAEAYEILTALHLSALGYRSGSFGSSPTGTEDAWAQQDSTESTEWLTTTEAAEIVGVTGRCVRKWIAKQRLPAKWLGDRYMIRRHDLHTVQALAA